MKAEFFRMLVRKTRRGIYYTGACHNEKTEETLHVAYIGEGAEPVEVDRHPLDILAVGDWKEDTLECLKQMVQIRKIKTVIFPKGTGEKSIEDFCKEYGVIEVIKAEETISLKQDRWELLFATFEGVDGDTLVMYQGFSDVDRKKEDCVLSGKVMDGNRCVPCICGEDDYCGFGCLREKDFQMLKGHKRGDSEGYRLGTLILGSMCLKGQSEKLEEWLSQVSGKIRTVLLPFGTTSYNYEKHLLKSLEDTDYIYAIGMEGAVSQEVAGTIVTSSPYIQYQLVNENYGFCISGYRIPYLKEKDC